MRDPNRIPPTILFLWKFWNRYPDLRFFQMMQALEQHVKARSKMDDLFYLDDDSLEAILKDIK